MAKKLGLCSFLRGFLRIVRGFYEDANFCEDANG